MDGTFTVSSQSDHSPLSGGVLCFLLRYSTSLQSLYQRRELNSFLFPTSAFDADVFDN